MSHKLRMLGRNFYTFSVFDTNGEPIFLYSGGKAYITKMGDQMGFFLEDDFKRVKNEYKRYRESRMFMLRQKERVLDRT
tara:strand:+ start:1133 stop:1369 length:237 start_codon:yes stop_codon:yes gene_type:complete